LEIDLTVVLQYKIIGKCNATLLLMHYIPDDIRNSHIRNSYQTHDASSSSFQSKSAAEFGIRNPMLLLHDVIHLF